VCKQGPFGPVRCNVMLVLVISREVDDCFILLIIARQALLITSVSAFELLLLENYDSVMYYVKRYGPLLD